MLTIGVDTYINVAQATKYIELVYGDNSEVYTYWDNLDNGEKEMLLTKSLLQIEALPYTGRRKYENQTLEFPRTNGVQCKSSDNIASEIPVQVKYAQIDNAIAMFNIAENSENKNRLNLQRNGVKSFSLGEFSETYADSSSFSMYNVTDQNVISLLKQWLSGGYRIV